MFRGVPSPTVVGMDGSGPLRHRPTTGWATRPPLVDALIAVAFVLMVIAEATFSSGVRWPAVYVLVAGSAMASLAWRRRIPLCSCALVAIANFGLDSVDQFSPFLAMVLVMFTVGAEAERRQSYVGLAIMLVPFVAHRWLAKGGSESGLMAIAGWTRTDMLVRYTRARASERAAQEAQRLNLGDLGAGLIRLSYDPAG